MSQSRPSTYELRDAFALFSADRLKPHLGSGPPKTFEYVISDLAGAVPDWVWDGMVVRETVQQPVIEYVISVEDEDVAVWHGHLVTP